METPYLIAIVIGSAVIGAVAYYFYSRAADDDDRPVIIVRGGSVELVQQTQEWELDPKDSKKGRPKQPNGGHVTGFMVTFDPADAGGTTGCPALPVVGGSLDIEYQPALVESKREHVFFNSISNGHKNEPWIIAPEGMTLSPNKKMLIHRDGDHGAIVSVTINYANASLKCAPSKQFEVKPLR